MKLVQVDDIPKRSRRHDLQKLIQSFSEGGLGYALVAFAEYDYSTYLVCYSCLHRAALKSHRPIRVIMRDKKIYLAKR